MDGEASSSLEVPECAVCLQNCIHPVQLTCKHIFCFLCVKGVAIQSKRCPMCRREIPSNYLENPVLLRPLQVKEDPDPDGDAAQDDQEECKWFYEGRNGWWLYDERTALEIENHHKKGDKVFELLIAGFLYTIDLETMVQYRRNDPNRRRRIQRETNAQDLPKKGIAGLRIPMSQNSSEALDSNLGTDSQAASSAPLPDLQNLSINDSQEESSREPGNATTSTSEDAISVQQSESSSSSSLQRRPRRQSQ